jgi:hypothetical protein
MRLKKLRWVGFAPQIPLEFHIGDENVAEDSKQDPITTFYRIIFYFIIALFFYSY